MMTEMDNLHENADGEKKDDMPIEGNGTSETPETEAKQEVTGETPEETGAETEAPIETPQAEANEPETPQEEIAEPETPKAEEPAESEAEKVETEAEAEEAVEESPAEEPDADEPASEESAKEETVTEETASEEPVAEEPVVEEAVTEEPVAETSSDEETSAEKPDDSDDKSEDYKFEETESDEDSDDAEEEIPFKNYEELPLPVIIGEAKALLKNYSANKIREHFNQMRDAVRKITDEDRTAKQDAYVEEQGSAEGFYYDNQDKKEFDRVYYDFRKQLDFYHKEREKALEDNLVERNQLIEELKALYLEPNEDNSNIFNKFRQIKTRWHNAGPIPRAQAGNVFRTYFHHLDNFYNYLDLNKELRELDYAHNLEVRESIINRAEQLTKEDNIQKALNELQYLHKLWKEEAVPVAEEFREPTWQKFKELTQKIHDRKGELNEKIKAELEENLEKKRDVLSKIKALMEDSGRKTHGDWQNGIRKLKALREQFMEVGRVPREFNQKMWDEFKEASRSFNHAKNEFYKNLKSEQQENLEKKRELLRIAKEHATSTDWKNSVEIVKKIQADWKKIGHVPRKFSDSIWKEFKAACNEFFEAYKSRGDENAKGYEENFIKKAELLNELKSFQPGDDQKENLDRINDFNLRWAGIGKVPASKMGINTDFNKTIREMVRAQGLSEKEVKDFKVDSLVGQIKSDQDERRLDDEIRRTRKVIDELEKEVNQLETNISFFSNADESNPLLKDTFDQIAEKRKRLTEAEIKLRKLSRIDFDDEPEEDEGAAQEDDNAGA